MDKKNQAWILISKPTHKKLKEYCQKEGRLMRALVDTVLLDFFNKGTKK